MNITEAKRVIGESGFKVQEVEALKGSCMVQGLSIGEGSVRPTVYESGIKDMDEHELIAFVTHAMDKAPQVNLTFTKDKDYILDHCVSCIRHRTDDEKAVKWDVYGDLEEYIRIDLGSDDNNNNMSTVVTNELLESSGVSREELRAYARKNLKKTVRIQSMTEVLSGLMGDMALGVPEPDVMMYVAKNESRINGAAVMLLENVLKDFCNQHNLDSIYIIPSSLHEVILTSSKMPLCEIDSMIREVNETQVDPWEQLSDHVYTFVA